MNAIKYLHLSLLLFLILAPTSEANAQLQLYNFNEAGQLAEKFYSTGGSAWEQASSGGLDDSGWVKRLANNEAHAAQVLNSTFSGQTPQFTISIFFQWQTLTLSGSGPSLYLGVGANSAGEPFVPKTTGASAATQGIYFGINAIEGSHESQKVRVAAYTLINGESKVSLGSTTAEGLVSGNWYSLSAEYILNAEGTGYHLNIALADADFSGNIGELLAHYTSTGQGLLHPDLVSRDLHAYFIVGSNAQMRGIAGIDNFAVIPEPSSTAMLLLVAPLLLGASRIPAIRRVIYKGARGPASDYAPLLIGAFMLSPLVQLKAQQNEIKVKGEILPVQNEPNLVLNHQFQEGTEDWEVKTASGVLLDVQKKTEAEAPFLRIEKTGDPDSAWLLSKPFEVTPGEEYEVTGLYRTTSAQVSTTGEFILQTAPSLRGLQVPPPAIGPKASAHQGHQLLLRNGWRRKTRLVTPPADHKMARLIFAMAGAGATLDVANLRVAKVEPDSRQKPELALETPLPMEEALERLSARPDSHAKVELVNGAPTLFIDGKKEVPLIHMSDIFQPRRGYINAFSRSGITLHTVSLFNKTGNYWRGKQDYDLSKIDEVLHQSISRDPEGHFIVALNLLPYKHWHTEFPDSAARYSEGKLASSRHGDFGPPSYWSLEYQKQAFEYIKTCISHIHKQPYAKAIIGYHITGGDDMQFYYQTTAGKTPLLDGTSPGDLPLFRQWLAKRYGNDVQQLRQAWNDPAVTFDTAHPILGKKKLSGVFLNPVTERAAYDNLAFLNEGVAQFLTDAASLIKETSPKPVIVGAYYGRGASFSVYPLFAQTSIMFPQRKIDFMGAQGGYFGRREVGSSSSVNWVYDSVRRANIIPMMEMDYRTWLSGFVGLQRDFHTARYWTIEEFSAAVNREVGRQISFGGGGWWMEMTGGWFHDPAIMESLAHTRRIAQELSEREAKYTPAEVVLVADEKAYFWTTEQINVWNGPQYLSLARQQKAFHEAGIKVDFYYLSDLLKSPEARNYKVYCFLNPYYPDEETKAFANTLQASGKTLVWQYAPGWMTDEGFSVEAMRALTGFEFRHDGIAPEGLRSRFVAEHEPKPQQESSILLNHLLDEPTGIGVDIATDRFVATGGFDGVLSRFVDGGEPSAVWRRDPNNKALSIYLGHPAALSPQLLANIAKVSGVHQYTEPGDLFFYHRDDLIVVHGVAGGKKTLTLPFKARIKERLKGELRSASTRHLAFDLSPGETLWFDLMPSQ